MSTQTTMDRYLTGFFRNRAEGQFALASTVIRVLSGLIFTYYGFTKLTGLSWTTAQFRVMGFPDTSLIPLLVGLLELVGGLMLVAGLGTRLAVALLGLEMIGACAATLGIMNGRPWFLIQPLLMLVLMVFLLWSGPARYALDDRFQDWLRRTLPGHFGFPTQPIQPSPDASTGPIPTRRSTPEVRSPEARSPEFPSDTPDRQEPRGTVPGQSPRRAPARPVSPGARAIGRPPRLPADAPPPPEPPRHAQGGPPEQFGDQAPQPPEPRRPPGQSRHGH